MVRTAVDTSFNAIDCSTLARAIAFMVEVLCVQNFVSRAEHLQSVHRNG
jgi:hypothetical protein